MSLDKVLQLAGRGVPAAPPSEVDLAAELVRAACEDLAEAMARLASDGDDDDDDDDGDGKGKGKRPPFGKKGSSESDDDGDDDGDHDGHSTKKALKKKGMSDKRAAELCAVADNRFQAAALVEAALIALGGLSAAAGSDWVEATAYDPIAVALAGGKGDGSKPYGDVTYADPGYQSDGKHRYPVDNEEHARAAWGYINKAKNAAAYSSAQLSSIKTKIRAALKRFNIGTSEESDSDGEKAAASMISLAAKAMGDGGVPMHHPPFNGTHTHSHHLTAAHGHPHQHVNDNTHEAGPLHRPGSGSGWGDRPSGTGW